MSNPNSLRDQFQSLETKTLLYFFHLMIPDGNETFDLYFHCNGSKVDETAAGNSVDYQPFMDWMGQQYTFVGIDIEGLQLSSGGKVNTPKLSIANEVMMQKGYVTTLCRMFNDLRGAKLKIYMTTGLSYDNNTGQYIEQNWYVEQKTSATYAAVEFELKSPLDFKSQRIPTRLISPYCAWAMRGEYRGEVCGYTGTNYFDEKGNPVASPTQDKCGGRFTDCAKRFGDGARLPFGGQLVTYENGNW